MKKVYYSDVVNKAKYLSTEDIKFVKKAYNFAVLRHKGQKRKTGEDFIIHPTYTAYYIADLGLGRDAISASFLHDVIEDCGVTKKELREMFNPTVATLVSSVTKLRHTADQKITSTSVENLRRFFLVAAKDIRAVIIKLADRLHNAQTIEGLPKKRQKEYAKEIKYVFSTLSMYLGLGFFKRQFDEVSFKILKPTEYKKIQKYFTKHHKKRGNYVRRVEIKLNDLLKENHIKAEVSGRDKPLYSFYNKLKHYLREGEIHSRSEYGRIYDNYGFRILVNSKEDCYKALGVVHSTWHPLPKLFDDYIANPKANGYQSLQTTVFCEKEKIAEIQIRTFEMHEYNEFGPASHIAYKLSGKREIFPTTAFNWIRSINIFRRGVNKEDKSIYKVKVFQDNIFVLTPANEVKSLPKGSTPVDFAYSVHSEVGNKCRGAKVNGKLVQLDHHLQTGDQIEIILDKNAKYPISKWLEFVATSSARAKIKQTLRDKESHEAKELGLKKMEELLKKHKTSFQEIYRNRKNDIDILMYKNNATSVDNFLSHIGFDLIKAEKIVSELFPKKKIQREYIQKKGVVEIEGSNQTEYTLAKCCSPEIEDDIVAVNTIANGIRIHKKSCKRSEKFPKSKLYSARWI